MVSQKSDTILVIEDNDDIRDNLIESLLVGGYTNVLEAISGNQGIELCLKYIPDLIICDIWMVNGDGYKVLDAIVHAAKTHEIPFIFSTSTSERKDLRLSLQLGADEILVKPYDLQLLLKTVKDLLLSGSKRKNKSNPYK